MVPLPYRVTRVRRETADVSTLHVEPGEDAVAPFTPGQFNMLYAFGVGEVPVSVSGDLPRPGALAHTVRAVGQATRALCSLKRGDLLGLRGPFGNGWPLAEGEGKDVVIVAGGIGLAPLRPVMRHLLAGRARYGRVILLYGGRTPRDLVYQSDLVKWRSRFDLEVEITVDSADEEWRGNVGVVTRLIPRAPFDPQDALAMVCGPEVMMRFTVAELQDRGVPLESIYVSLERNMKCAIGFCGRCQFGPEFVCKDGPVFRYDRIASLLRIREV